MIEVQLCGELGGTHARWFFVQEGQIVDKKVHLVVGYDTVFNSLDVYLDEYLGDRKITAAAIGVPGSPKYRDEGKVITFTNAPILPDGTTKPRWVVGEAAMSAHLNIPKKNMVAFNDYELVVPSLDTLQERDFTWLTANRPSQAHNILAIGPGTGLGIGRGQRVDGRLYTSPSEGPHDLFVAVDSEQGEIVGAVRKITGTYRVTNEDMACFSRGLPNIHGALRLIAREAVTRDKLLPNQAIIAAAQEGDPIAVAAVNHHFKVVGGIAGRKAIDPKSDVVILGLDKHGPLLDETRKQLLLGEMTKHPKADEIGDISVALIAEEAAAADKGLLRALQIRGLAATNG